MPSAVSPLLVHCQKCGCDVLAANEFIHNIRCKGEAGSPAAAVSKAAAECQFSADHYVPVPVRLVGPSLSKEEQQTMCANDATLALSLQSVLFKEKPAGSDQRFSQTIRFPSKGDDASSGIPLLQGSFRSMVTGALPTPAPRKVVPQFKRLNVSGAKEIDDATFMGMTTNFSAKKRSLV